MATRPNRTPVPVRRQPADRRYYARYLPDGRPQCQAETTQRKQCTNPAGPGSAYCRAVHKYGKSFVGPKPSPSFARPRRTAPQPGAQQQMRSVFLPITYVPRTSEVIYAVKSADRQGWSQSVESYVIQQVGTRGWARLKSHWRTPNCKKLAALAEQCDQLSSSSELRFLEGVPLINELLEPFNPVAVRGRQSALLLRALGVAICMAHGAVRQCACLKALIDVYGDVPDLIVSLLRQALPA